MEKKLIITINSEEKETDFSVISKNGFFKDEEIIGLLEMLKFKISLMAKDNWTKIKEEKNDKKTILCK